VSFSRLISELQTAKTEEEKEFVLEQIVAKLRRKRAKLERDGSDHVHAAAGTSPSGLIERLRAMTPAQAAAFFDERDGLIDFLDRVYGSDRPVPIAPHSDAVIGVETGYGNGTKPEDYLE